jgi:hypothetical protein
MIKLFRKTRQRLLTENLPNGQAGKFSKYLLYAIGEIVLVVIGILIALSINNWNEDKKLKHTEQKVLIEIKNALSDDLSYGIKANIFWSKECLKIKVIKEQIQLEKPTNDSLNHHFAKFLMWQTADIYFGPYEILKSKGLELISNDELRSKIIYYYEQTAKHYIDQNYYLPNQYYLEYCAQLFNTFAFGNNPNGILPNDFGSLKKDQKFKSLLNTKEGELNFKMSVSNKASSEIKELIEMISEELAN